MATDGTSRFRRASTRSTASAGASPSCGRSSTRRRRTPCANASSKRTRSTKRRRRWQPPDVSCLAAERVGAPSLGPFKHTIQPGGCRAPRVSRLPRPLGCRTRAAMCNAMCNERVNTGRVATARVRRRGAIGDRLSGRTPKRSQRANSGQILSISASRSFPRAALAGRLRLLLQSGPPSRPIRAHAF